jgi:fatty acid desaturase
LSVSTPENEAALAGTAYKLCADLARARPAVYWTDLLLTALVAYASFAGAILLPDAGLRLLAGAVSVLAFYRGISFIHELTHMRPGDVPGFKAGYNLLIGIPFLIPSLMYEGVHNLHHAKSRYGTAADPEYMPLAQQTGWHVIAFVVVSALAPAGLLLRFGVLTPLAALFPRLRTPVVERFSALAINPAFRRDGPTAQQRGLWLALEAACCAWALFLLIGTATGLIPLPVFLTVLAVGSGVAVINQVRTLAAHHWEHDGAELSSTAQFLDSVNVPPPAMLPVLWAPVGLRYHALHHLLPRLPYHSLGTAHARLVAQLPATSVYHQGNHPHLRSVVQRLLGEIRRKKRGAVQPGPA